MAISPIQYRQSNDAFSIIFRCVIVWLLAMVSMNASATAQCYQWRASAGRQTTDWYDDPNKALDAAIATCNATVALKAACMANAGCPLSDMTTGICVETVTSVSGAELQTFPIYSATLQATPVLDGFAEQPVHNGAGFDVRTNPAGCQSYISVLLPPQTMCGPWCNGVGHPINPANGAVYDSMSDVNAENSAIHFDRFYNSTNATGTDLSRGWQHSFTRNVQSHYSSTDYRPYEVIPDNSSLYNDEATACTNGFAEIRSRVSNWANDTAAYVNGSCVISANNVFIATLPILYNAPPTPAPGSNFINAYDVTRDDGQLIRFAINNGVITAPPGINLQLQQTSSGFTITDSNDNVEQYDTNGKLLTVTSRGGVVQTMNYDSSNRLGSVVDSFGHQLIFSYDAQGHLSSVTRQ